MNCSTNYAPMGDRKSCSLCKWKTIVLSATFLFFGFSVLFYYRATTGLDYRLYYTLLRAVPSQEMCAIPRTDPWDSSIQKYLSDASPLVCKKLQSELTYLDSNGTLYFNKSEAAEAGYGQLKCEYRCFDRKQATDDVTLDYAQWITFQERAEPGCEFVEVHCSRVFPAISVYVNLHNQIIRKPFADHKAEEGEGLRRQPGVLLFVLDSVSRANWIRYLPLTLKVLKNDYGAYVFDGFTKVGDNSFPNAVAFLTGKRVQTAGYEDELKINMAEEFFDHWPIVWRDYKKAGYVTFYAEDYPQYNLFKYLSNGFKNPPTDHYFRPYWLQLYGSFLHRRSTHLCYGNNPCHRLQLNYLRQFIRKYKNEAKFALNWLTELGHDWLNQVSMGDEDLATFLKDLKEDLEEDFVFVFSDHGHRFDPIRQSVIGRIEERMPFFSMHLPRSILAANPGLHESLLNSTQQLTSFFDLYVTLRDILDRVGKNDWNLTQQPNDGKRFAQNGLSLLNPLPSKRNCDDAGIPDDFCICQRETLVNVTDTKVIRAANFLLRHINAMLKRYPTECARLHLKQIHHAQTFLPNIKMVLDPSISIFYGGQNPTGFFVNYRVMIEAEPSQGLFEGTLRNSIREDTFTVVGDVNRINMYGNQSFCINSRLLRKYCFCLN